MKDLGVKVGLSLAANAIGLVVAAVLLEKMRLGFLGFVVAVVIFTVLVAVARPVITRAAGERSESLGAAGIALLATFAALVVTTVLSDSLSISGVGTWALATIIVAVASTAGGVLLPKALVK